LPRAIHILSDGVVLPLFSVVLSPELSCGGTGANRSIIKSRQLILFTVKRRHLTWHRLQRGGSLRGQYKTDCIPTAEQLLIDLAGMLLVGGCGGKCLH